VENETKRDQRSLAELRVEYSQRTLSEQDVDPDPIKQLIRWLDEAVAAQVHEPNAMTVATCQGSRPTARIMLLKSVDQDGLVFFTNYQSRKAGQLDANPHAATVFWWPELQRQVRTEGTITRTSVKQSEEYFRQRPLTSRLGSAASPQSRVIASREELERRMEELAMQYPNGDVPCPPHWGGYCLRPHTIEFWQGRQSRLHDRLEYSWNDTAGWVVRRLAP
jgi:pyridoxamine 5'-phosphate oxidase